MDTMIDYLRATLKSMPSADRWRAVTDVEQLVHALEAEDIMAAEMAVEGRDQPTLRVGDYVLPHDGSTICRIAGFRWQRGSGRGPGQRGAWAYRLRIVDEGDYMLGHYFDGDYPFYGAQQLTRCTVNGDVIPKPES